MRENILRRRLAAHRCLIGAAIDFPEPRLVEFCGWLGFDYVFIDGEHGGVDVSTCYELVRAADAVGIGSFVRVPVNRPEVVLGYAETGANGILAPHVTTAAEAQALVEAVRFPPRGIRGAGPSARAANYGLTQPAVDYFHDESSRTVVAALIEDESAYGHLDDLAGVGGIDIYCLGLGDLSGSMGIPGQVGDPRVVALAEKAARRFVAQGKIVNVAAGPGASAIWAASVGARMIQVSIGGLLSQAGTAALDSIRTQFGRRE